MKRQSAHQGVCWDAQIDGCDFMGKRYTISSLLFVCRQSLLQPSILNFQPTCANADAIALEIALDEPLAMACETAFASEEPPPVLEADASALAAANAAA